MWLFHRPWLLVWLSAVLGKSCLLESLWVALSLIWRWYHCSKHFWNCPLGIAFGADLGHTGKSHFYFIATPSLWPKMVLPSLTTHFIFQSWLWLSCEPKLHPPSKDRYLWPRSILAVILIILKQFLTCPSSHCSLYLCCNTVQSLLQLNYLLLPVFSPLGWGRWRIGPYVYTLYSAQHGADVQNVYLL